VILGLDQSTSGTKLVVVNKASEILYKTSVEHQQYYPKAGYVEHDMDEIYNKSVKLLRQGLDFIEGNYEVENLSITNQRETIVFWDKRSGKPLCHGLVWQCRRGSDICNELNQEGYGSMVKEKTGLKLDPYFSGSKIKWALENINSVSAAKDGGYLAVGTVETYLIYRLTGGLVFKTEHTNASRTLLYNLTTCNWDRELMDLFGVSSEMLADIVSSNDYFGETDVTLFGKKIPISGVIGDSQGALFGQMCFEPGYGKATYGTGSSIMIYTGDKQVDSDKGIMTSVAWAIDGQVKYAMEGMVNSAGDTLKWVKDNLGLYKEDEEVENMINSLDSNEGVYIVPAFSGLGAPYWSAEAKASILGMTRKTEKAHIVRAAVESMAYQVTDLVDLMEEELGQPLQVLNVDGGPTQNSFLMQLQADLLGTTLHIGANRELSVLGAVYLGGLHTGFFENPDDLKSLKKTDQIIKPKKSRVWAALEMDRWHEAVNRVL